MIGVRPQLELRCSLFLPYFQSKTWKRMLMPRHLLHGALTCSSLTVATLTKSSKKLAILQWAKVFYFCFIAKSIFVYSTKKGWQLRHSVWFHCFSFECDWPSNYLLLLVARLPRWPSAPGQLHPTWWNLQRLEELWRHSRWLGRYRRYLWVVGWSRRCSSSSSRPRSMEWPSLVVLHLSRDY